MTTKSRWGIEPVLGLPIVTDADAITQAVQTALDSDGSHFILAKVTAEEANVPRIPYTPHQLRDRFRTSA
jgi:hypothetical protein